MKQEEFINLSKKEVKQLNAGYNNVDDHAESWRGGYYFLLEEIEKSFRNDNHETFLNKIENIVDQNLDIFE